MALCRTCHTVIPCHCHLAPPAEVRPGVYLATESYPADRPDLEGAQQAAATVNDGLDRLFRRLGPPADRDDEK